MATSEIINPNFEEKITNALKADRIVHRVTFNPNKASPGETLYIPVPKLNDEVVLVPGSLAVIFDLTVSGHANNFLVNNVSRALVKKLTVKFAGEILQDTSSRGDGVTSAFSKLRPIWISHLYYFFPKMGKLK